MRKLATTVRIGEIKEHNNADTLELTMVRGWQVVVRKGEFKTGDWAVYFEIDSWIPTKIAPFLTKNDKVKEFNGIPGNRLKTVKLRGELSQGLLIPVKDLFFEAEGLMEEGGDVTDILGIFLWEPPLPKELAGVARGNFPNYIRKTDLERIQNIYDTLGNYATYEVTEKMNGSSITMAYSNADGFMVMSRNINLKVTEDNKDNAFVGTAMKYGWDMILPAFCKQEERQLALQGELVGHGLNGNMYKFQDIKIFVFDIWDIDEQRYLLPYERVDVLEALESLAHAVINHVPLLFINATVEPLNSMIKMADGKSAVADVGREGLVWKSNNDPNKRFKVISNDYLLKDK